jgi:hypothetical protein
MSKTPSGAGKGASQADRDQRVSRTSVIQEVKQKMVVVGRRNER